MKRFIFTRKNVRQLKRSKTLMLLVLLLYPVFLFSQNSYKVFKDTVHVSELFTDGGKNMFTGNSIISDKTFCNGRICIWWGVDNLDTLMYKAIFEGELFTGIAENFEKDTLVGRFTFIDGEMIQSFTTYKDGSYSSINNFKNMLRDGEDLTFWDGKISYKSNYKNGALEGPYFAFRDYIDFDIGYVRVHGQYTIGKKDGLWVYSTTEEPWESLTETKVFNNLQQVGEILWTEFYIDGRLLNSTETF